MMMTAVAHPDARLLEAYSLGTLEFDEVGPLEEHLAECGHCCEMLNHVTEDSFLVLIRNAAVAETWEPAGEETMLLSPANETASQDDFGLVAAPSRADGSGDMESVPHTLLDHGRYRILGRCGSGGMGVVYRAEHRLMGREVALKVIRPHLLRRSDAVDRFRREVRAAASLSHPEHRVGLRRGRSRRLALSGDGVRRGKRSGEHRRRARAAVGPERLRIHPTGRGRPDARPRARDGAPGRQAAEPDAHERRQDQDSRLRLGEVRQRDGRRSTFRVAFRYDRFRQCESDKCQHDARHA